MDSESNVRHGQLQAAGAIRPSLAWCFTVAKESVLEAWESFWSWLLVIQKETLGTASCRQQAPFVLHWRCASVWRRDPFWKPRCQFGTSFL